MSQPIHLQDQNDRPTGQAMWRGTRGLCPSCGQGKMFRGYLKVSDHCPNCDEELHHQRADDGPAYLTILIVSHLAAPILLAYFIAFRPSAMTMIAIFGLGTVISSLLLLPRIKGAFVGFQWARRMHGFEGAGAETH
ncbi:DUF983 domain-containing protein [Paracoccus fistulariae]|uniref:DUF983 domain-containing protein n=1 Tax=Paracoccus fistulariae TaxID=658446 RepID=A0ABY7SKZ9_9RHOB|nr:DUF983 domain-containing protein [Paracoccus fistulariae]MDB6181581.1 DUF983 domain-containing protein [Paracoccus fistulariae]WCR07608.1 DUF983 domain-containing protein [Paracoccus fistulariae]